LRTEIEDDDGLGSHASSVAGRIVELQAEADNEQLRHVKEVASLLVVITGLKKINSVGGDFINQPMLLSNSPAPGATHFKSKWLRLPNADEGIGKHCFYKFQSANSRFAIVFDKPD
jgi:hypothetical protein